MKKLRALGLCGVSAVLVCWTNGSVRAAEGGAAADAAAQEAAEAAEEMESEPGIHVMQFSAGLDGEVVWHSNPYYRHEDIESDAWIYSLDPRFRLDAPLSEMLFLGLDAKVNMERVSFSGETEDEDKDVIQPFVQGKVRRNFGEYTSLAFYDDFQTANVGDIADKPRFYLNNATLEGSHEFTDDWSGSTWYRNTWLNQTESEALLFNSMENGVGASLARRLAQMDAGRDVMVTGDLGLGMKDFDDGDFFGQTSGTNPKSHTYLTGGGSMSYPFSSLMTLYGRLGVNHREYDVSSAVSDDKSDSLYGGLNLTVVPSPGSPLSFTLAGSYEVTDTMVYNIPESDRPVFESTDVLLNNLDIDYRELDVYRAGIIADYNATERLRLGLSCTFQRSEASAEEDLSSISGNLDPLQTGSGDATQIDQVVGVGTVRYRVYPYLTLGAGYQHGFATDAELAGDTDLYTYDSYAFLAELGF